MQKSEESIIRKLALPLKVKISDDGSVSDGFFKLTSKEASEIDILSIDGDGYAKCSISPPKLQKEFADISAIVSPHAFLGAELSKARGRGHDFGRYLYYRRQDGFYYAIVEGARMRRLQLGKPTEKSSPMWVISRTILLSDIKTGEFSKKQLTQLLPKKLGYGQILKASLDIMTIEGYLEKREIRPHGRLSELFKATEKLAESIAVMPRTGPESKEWPRPDDVHTT